MWIQLVVPGSGLESRTWSPEPGLFSSLQDRGLIVGKLTVSGEAPTRLHHTASCLWLRVGPPARVPCKLRVCVRGGGGSISQL